MKNLIEKIKNSNFKELLIDHAEKGVLAVIGLIVVISLVKTEWVPYDKQPDEFIAKADQGTRTLHASTWPDANRIALEKPKDVSVMVGELQTNVKVDKYELETEMFRDLYPRKEKIREPEWLPVENLVVSSGKVILDISAARFYAPEPDESELAANGNNGAAKPTTDDENDLARRNENAPRGNVPGPTQPQKTVAATPALAPGYSTRRGLGFRYVAVRGIFPLKDQYDKLAAALNESSISKASEMFDLINFELERQAAVSGDDPWSEPWEKVDINYAIRILRNVADFDTEVVDNGLTDSVITMPLPARLAGYWGSRGSHPRISQLDDEQREAQRLEDERLMEEYRKQMEMEKEQQPIQKGGFNTQIENVRQIRKDIYGGTKGQQLLKKIRQETNTTGVAPNASATIVGRLLLFRFFDFDVAPGNAYRYRVKLVIRNPNFERPIEELMDAAFAQGETRTSAWSQPSPAAVINRDVNYFVTKVDAPSGPRGISATLNVYQWYQEAGTTVRGQLKTVQPGQFIAALRDEDVDIKGNPLVSGGVKTFVLRPATNSFEVEDNVEISTGDVLVDLDVAPKIEPELHPDLQIESRRGPEIAAQALSVNRYGELSGLDTFSSVTGELAAQTNLERERIPWNHIKDKAKAAETVSDLDRELQKRNSQKDSSTTKRKTSAVRKTN